MMNLQAQAEMATPAPTQTAQPEAPARAEARKSSDMYFDFDLAWHPDLFAAVETLIAWSRVAHEGAAATIRGATGCGKSHLAQLVWEQFRPCKNIVFWNEVDLLTAIRGTYGTPHSERHIVERCRRAKLLILDDLGAAHVRNESYDWLHDIYYQLFDHRVESRRGTLTTTNLAGEALQARLGFRAYSRFVGALRPEFRIDLFNVPDYRFRRFEE